MAEALRDALTRQAGALSAMGEKGRSWMLRDFSWDRVGSDMLEAYRWIDGSGDRPATIR